MTFALIFQLIPFQFMNELDELIRKMIEYFNSVEEKLVCFFSLYFACTLLYFTDFELEIRFTNEFNEFI